MVIQQARIVTLATLIATAGGCAMPEPPGGYVSLYGDPAPLEAARRTIELHTQVPYVNVEGGETVRFVVDGKAFAWTFNVARTVTAFDLREVAPPGMLSHRVVAYVAPHPRYFSWLF